MTFTVRLAAMPILIAISIQALQHDFLRAQVPSVSQSATPSILMRDQAASIMPATVFFRGQSASVQARNSAGLKMPDGKLVLAALVDTSGYSSSLQQTYQGYLLSEVPLTIGGRTLSPGAYGFGFVAGNIVTVMDLGGNEVLRGTTLRDEAMARPNPLQILPDPKPATFRLYLGRSYVSLHLSAN